MSKLDDELDQLAAEAATLSNRSQRAAHAAGILDDEMFRAAVQAVRDGLVREFTTAKPENLLDVRLMYDALERVVSALGEHIRDGQIVNARLDAINQRRTFLQRLRVVE